MSERMSFTSEFIYDDEDYKKLRNVFEEHEDSKWLSLAPESKWSNGKEVFNMPIIQGKVCCISEFPSEWILCHMLKGIKTNERIRFAVMKDTYASGKGIMSLTKTPDGEINYCLIGQEEIDEESDHLYINLLDI